jgi:branched-chain amino acid transport system permease protein
MVETAAPALQDAAPRAASEFDRRKATKWGVYGGIVAIFVSSIGMVEAFSVRLVIDPILNLGYAFLIWIPVAFGFFASREKALEGLPPPRAGPHRVVAGAVSGMVGGAAFGSFTLVISGLSAYAQSDPENFDIRGIFTNISPRLVELLAFDRGAVVGAVVWLAIFVALGAAGGATHLMQERWRRAVFGGFLWVFVFALSETVVSQVLRQFGLDVSGIMYSNRGLTLWAAVAVFVVAVVLSLRFGERRKDLTVRFKALGEPKRRRYGLIGALGLLVLAGLLPVIIGSLLTELLVFVGLFVLLGLGLNIVVGLAGLLDLGYVAFFAVGAYSMAVLTSPGSPAFAPQLSFWLAIPFVILAAAVAGVLVGTPVIRMRGDYLAIVTLGFGEIARILFLSDWFKPVFGGAQGILQIPSITIGPVTVQGTVPQNMFYMILAFVALAAFVSWRLQDSRIGRAWMAMREDEQVAEVMGINTVSAKLLAFVVGAILASFGGALFAVKIGSIFPNSFQLLVSIIVLVVIIVGGMGNIPGVAAGAIVLIGILGGPTNPGLLREFEEFKLLIYGALLIMMMLLRPEGLIPSARRAQELHQEEYLQDAWLKGEGDTQAPAGPATEAEATS